MIHDPVPPLPMEPQDEPPFELRVGPFLGSELRVVAFKGKEAISELFAFDVVVTTTVPPLVVEACTLGQAAHFMWRVPGHPPQERQGIISRVRMLRGDPKDSVCRFALRLVPRLWLLQRTKRSRIFQDRSAKDIAAGILEEYGLTFRWDVTRRLATREYAVQYQESDYAFLTRLLADEGVYFLFRHATGLREKLETEVGALEHVDWSVLGEGGMRPLLTAASVKRASALSRAGLVESIQFGDDATYPPIAGPCTSGQQPNTAISISSTATVQSSPLSAYCPELPFRDEGMEAADECVLFLGRERSIRPKVLSLRDFDFQKPMYNPVGTYASETLPSPLPLGGPQPESVTLPFSFPAALLEHYEHEGALPPNANAHRAKRRLQSLRKNATRLSGVSVSRRIEPGHRFRLVDHPTDALNAPYVVTTAAHRGSVPSRGVTSEKAVYENTFECVPAGIVCRPKAVQRARQVVETAIVTGRANDEIHTDSLGRVTVRFPWDRSETEDERSSCWIRVGQSWAGDGWGFQFIPRVGMEVVVLFVLGDVDRPMVLGAVPNPVQMPPFPLPSAKNVSGIRTRSTPDGTSSTENVFAFDDTRGHEEIYLHAERNLRIEAEQDHLHDVGYVGSERATGSQKVRIADDQECTLGRDQKSEIGRNQVTQVRGDRRDDIAGNLDTQVGQHVHRMVARTEWNEVFAHRFESVGGMQRSTIEGDRFDTVHGDAFGRAYGRAWLQVGSEYKLTSQEDIALGAGSTLILSAGDRANMVAGRGFRISCGNSYLELLPDSIVLSADALTLRAATTQIQGSDASLTLENGEAALVAAKRARLDACERTEVVSGDAQAVWDAASARVTLRADELDAHGTDSFLKLAAGDATLSAGKISLDTAGGAKEPSLPGATPAELKTSWVSVRLIDQDGEPRVGARYELTMSNGEALRGTLDRKGEARVAVVPGPCKVAFPEYDSSSWELS